MHIKKSGGFRREHYRSSSTFYGDKRGVYQGFGSPQTQYQANRSTLPPTHGKSYHVRHTYRNCCRQPINYCTTTNSDLHWLVNPIHYHQKCTNTCDVLYSNEHYSTYGTQHPLTTNNSFARTSAQRAPTAITLFPLGTTLSSEQCTTSSCHTFPPEKQWGLSM